MKAKTWTVRACSLLLAAAIGLTTAAAAAADGRAPVGPGPLRRDDPLSGRRGHRAGYPLYGGGSRGLRRCRQRRRGPPPGADEPSGDRSVGRRRPDHLGQSPRIRSTPETIGGQAERAVLKGNNVVAVVNADPYDMDYGINTGIMVQDGCIVDSQPNTAHTTDTPVFFVREDGTAQIDSLRTAGEIAVGGG